MLTIISSLKELLSLVGENSMQINYIGEMQRIV
jgi:hypothetical protein